MWDRSKQNYYISRHGSSWNIIDMKTDKEVCTSIEFYDAHKTEQICFAESDDEVKKIVDEIIKETEEYLEKYPFMKKPC